MKTKEEKEVEELKRHNTEQASIKLDLRVEITELTKELTRLRELLGKCREYIDGDRISWQSIKHIYITKEGEPMANPDMEYPTLYFISGGHEVARTDLDEALAIYHSGLLPFEDITLFKAATWGNGPFVFLPSTLIPVDLEVEVVEQYRNKKSSDWYGYDPKLNGPKDFEPNDYEYRKVLRIKP